MILLFGIVIIGIVSAVLIGLIVSNQTWERRQNYMAKLNDGRF